MNLDALKTLFYGGLFEIIMLPSRIIDLTEAINNILPNGWYRYWFWFRFYIHSVCYKLAFFLTKVFTIIPWVKFLWDDNNLRATLEKDILEERFVSTIAEIWSEKEVLITKSLEEGDTESVDMSFLEWLIFYSKDSQPVSARDDVSCSMACVKDGYKYRLLEMGKREVILPIENLLAEYRSRRIRDELRLF
jgi:hypothetical protein